MAGQWAQAPIAVVLAGWLGACQTAAPGPPDRRAPAESGPVDAETPAPPPIDWARAPDCQAKLALLEEAVRAGRLAPGERVPIVVAVPGSGSDDWFGAPRVALTADLPLELLSGSDPAPADAPCVILVEQPQGLRVRHRPVTRHTVRSMYESGVRSERNPDYDIAQARVRQAERRLKDDGPSILKVGDPMLDLIGLMVGGLISGFTQGQGRTELDEALSELARTPRSRDRPVYRPYQFEQIVLEAGKDATIPVALIDRQHGRVWHSELYRRERREFRILRDLDPRDRDYDQHRAGGVTPEEYELWRKQPPEIRLSAIAAALRDADGAPADASFAIARAGRPTSPAGVHAARPSDVAVARRRSPRPPDDALIVESDPLVDRSADDLFAEGEDDWLEPDEEAIATGGWEEDRDGARAERLPGGTALALPQPFGLDLVPAAGPAARGPALDRPSADPRAASVVRIDATRGSGGGFYVGPDLVLTTARLVDGSSVVDVATADGTTTLGLVARADPVRDLALVHVPRPGVPVTLYTGGSLSGRAAQAIALTTGNAVAVVAVHGGRAEPASSRPVYGAPVRVELGAPIAEHEGVPLFQGDRVIGMIAGNGATSGATSLLAVRANAIRDFLEAAEQSAGRS